MPIGLGGGGDTIDFKFHDRMADIAEVNLGMGKALYNLSLYGVPYEGDIRDYYNGVPSGTNITGSGTGVRPLEEWEKDYAEGSGVWMYKNPDTGKWMTEKKAREYIATAGTGPNTSGGASGSTGSSGSGGSSGGGESSDSGGQTGGSAQPPAGTNPLPGWNPDDPYEGPASYEKMNQAMIEEGMKTIPGYGEYVRKQIAAGESLIDPETFAKKAGYEFQQKSYETDTANLPWKGAADQSAYKLATTSNNYARGLVPLQSRVARQALEQEWQKSPWRTEAEIQGWRTDSLQEQWKRPVLNKYYKQSAQGVNEKAWMDQAEGEVAQKFGDATSYAHRMAGRRGVAFDPQQEASLAKSIALEQAKATAAARTTARMRAEDTEYARLSDAVRLQ